MSYASNVYYHPDKNGAELVAELDRDDLSYEYDTTIMLRRVSDGAIFLASDSGCSCPTPFEDYVGLESMERAHTLEQVQRFADENAPWATAVERAQFAKDSGLS